MGKSIREFLEINSYDKDINDNQLSHEEKYAKIVNAIGIEKLISLLPIHNKEVLKTKYQNDENLNNIPLKEWDAQHYFVKHCLLQIGISSTSLSETVCILKQTARMYINC